jgi:hypothetical protein
LINKYDFFNKRIDEDKRREQLGIGFLNSLPDGEVEFLKKSTCSRLKKIIKKYFLAKKRAETVQSSSSSNSSSNYNKSPLSAARKGNLNKTVKSIETTVK